MQYEGPAGGVSSRHHDSRVDYFVNHDSQKINFHGNGSRKYKKKSVEKRIKIAKMHLSQRTKITHQAPPIKEQYLNEIHILCTSKSNSPGSFPESGITAILWIL